jgi:F-type H+-transporting ATPase subunit b
MKSRQLRRAGASAWATLRNGVRLAATLMLSAVCALAAEQEHEGGGLQGWKWANFLLLAAGIGYLIGKNAGPFFAARSRALAKDLADSDFIRQDAGERAAAVERRLAALESEIAGLRAEAQAETQAETERQAAHRAAEIAKIQEHAKQEIDAAAKAARMDLRRYSAELAIHLAEQRIRAGITPASEDNLVRGFVRDLK